MNHGHDHWVAWLLAAVLLCTTASNAAADDFEITISVKSSEKELTTATTRRSPTRSPRPLQLARPEADDDQASPPRLVLVLSRDQTARVHWHARNTSKTTEFKGVLVHFVVVKQERTGQREVPKLDERVACEGALTMDFKPGEKVDWNFELKLHETGSYLLRVETLGLMPAHEHEHHAALDLVVK